MIIRKENTFNQQSNKNKPDQKQIKIKNSGYQSIKMKNINLSRKKQVWKSRIKQEIQRKKFRKDIFGDHYNYERVKINNNKKYFNEQVKIMEIQKQNRLLLEKIKKISQRSQPRQIIQRAKTQANYELGQELERLKRKQNSFRFFRDHARSNTMAKKQRYESSDNILQKTRLKCEEQTHPSPITQLQPYYKNQNNITIFQGQRLIDNEKFAFKICIQDQNYIIKSETNENHQKIQIPLKDYKMLLKQELNDCHLDIFKILKVNGQHKKLELQGTRKLQIDLVEKAAIELPLVRRKRSRKFSSNQGNFTQMY